MMPDLLKIAVVAPEHPGSPKFGGIGRYLRDYLPELAKHADVTMISIEDGEPLPGVPQRVVRACRLPSPLAPPVRSARIQRALRELRPDCVEYANFLALGCRDRGPWARIVRMSTPVALGTLRPGIMPRLARPLHTYWERVMMRRMHHAISNTQANVRTCREAYGTLPPVTVIPHGASLNEQRQDPVAADVLFVGRFAARKGVDVLLHAWEMLVREHPEGSEILHLVGRDMPGQSGSYLADSLQERCIPPGRIQVHGVVKDAQVDRLRRQCAIAVIPSRYESFGMVALEAFAAGQLVVASAAGGLTEVVKDGRTGLLVPPEDAAALATALFRGISDHALRGEITANARRDLHATFSVEQMVVKSLAVYENVLHAKDFQQ